MALRLDIGVDTSVLQGQLDALGSEAPRAIMRAVNRTAMSVQTEAVRALGVEVGLKQKDVRKALSVQRARLDLPTAAVIVTGKRIPLIAFGARGPEPSRGRGKLTYRIGTSGRTTVPGGFIATMASGHRGAFKRRREKREMRRGRYAGKVRQPIQELFGPSLPHVVVKSKIIDALRARAAESLEKNLKHEIAFLLTGGKRVAVARPAGSGPTWREFVGQRMGPLMKELGSHGAAMRQIGQEWRARKTN